VRKLHADLKAAHDRRDDWKAGQLGIALAYAKGELRDLYHTRDASRPADAPPIEAEILFR
jgi:hypothetical protein